VAERVDERHRALGPERVHLLHNPRARTRLSSAPARHPPSGGILVRLVIHRSAWKGSSQKFVCRGFPGSRLPPP
jgi:hypothetical protein